MPEQSKTILLIANPSPEHVGAHFVNGAQKLGVPMQIMDSREAYKAPRWLGLINWRLRGHRPTCLNAFSRKVVETCRIRRPRAVITTGISPVTAEALAKIGEMGIKRLNFLTDDPWNPRNGARFFWEALPRYDIVFSPRQANLSDLRGYGCKKVCYLPFAYAPEIHFPEKFLSEKDQERFTCDISFIGGADDDRVSYVSALAKEGFDLKLYGGYWDRYSQLRPYCRGFVLQGDFRKAVAGSRVNLCMGRRANRDGHAMRSYEFPAMGAVMIVEDTEEHRDLFGREGECVLYFKTIREMNEKTRRLLENGKERARMAQAAHLLVTSGRNAYKDRLESMLEHLS